jgi:glycosyltransferase involved in cell wall biosynthesis
MDRPNWELASYLAKLGFTTHLVSHEVDADLCKQPNIIVHKVPKPLDSFLFGEPLLDFAGRHWARRLSSSSLRVVVNGGNCVSDDANWVHYVHAAWPNRADVSRSRRWKILLSRRFFEAREKAAVRKARLVMANSERTKSDLANKVGIDPTKIKTIYYGCDSHAYRPADDCERHLLRTRVGFHASRPLVMFIGGLGDVRKGFDTAFNAWSRLCARSSWDADLVVAGSGAELGYWKRRARELHGARRIYFLGFRKDISDIMRACDALVAPTRYEAFGLAVQEALCCGLAAMVSRDSGVAERYPADLADLLLPNPDDVDDLVNRLVRWRADLSSYRRRIVSLSERLRQHTWDHMAREMLTTMEAYPICSGDSVRDISITSAAQPRSEG